MSSSTKKRKLQEEEDTTGSSDNPTTTQKETTAIISSSSSSLEEPPLYGTQEYWEQRYTRNDRLLVKHKELDGCQENDNNNNNNNDNVEKRIENDDEGLTDSAALPMHEWYFSYDDLKPLLFPLLLGDNDDDSEDDDDDDDDDKAKGQQTKLNEEEEEDDKQGNTNNEKHDKDDVEFDDDDDEEEEEEQPHRPGLVQNGVPLSILEVGCGDAPLGTDLAKDLLQLEKEQDPTTNKPKLMTKEVICCDYSASAIDILQKHNKCLTTTTTAGKTSDETASTTTNTTNDVDDDKPPPSSPKDNSRLVDTRKIINFVVADARQMEYTNGHFHLILEKGTLDAMLSDKQEGIPNCVQIVQECARVLAIGGYIVIISHLNANTDAGMTWLDDVVVPGLRAGGSGNDYSWEIEVHGNNDIPDVEMEEDENNQEGCDDDNDDPDQAECNSSPEEQEEEEEGGQLSGEGPGPAVYVIHKKPCPTLKTKDSDTEHDMDDHEELPTIPLKFFSY